MCGLNEKEHLNELEQLVAWHYPRQYPINIHICQIAVNSTVEELPKWFIVEIDSEQNKKLLKDPGHRFFTDALLSWRETERVEHGFKQSNLYKKIRVYKWLTQIFIVANRKWLG